jgi:hypothetical protein
VRLSFIIEPVHMEFLNGVILCLIYGDNPAELLTWEKLLQDHRIYAETQWSVNRHAPKDSFWERNLPRCR